MPDRDKVIKGLECCSHTDGTNCIYCPYDMRDTDCTALISMDVLALLKEQESIIESLKSDLYETLEVVSGRLNVVRCKDCKYAHKTYDGDCKYCDMFTDDDGNPIERYRSGDWFCADGEMEGE